MSCVLTAYMHCTFKQLHLSDKSVQLMPQGCLVNSSANPNEHLENAFVRFIWIAQLCLLTTVRVTDQYCSCCGRMEALLCIMLQLLGKRMFWRPSSRLGSLWTAGTMPATLPSILLQVCPHQSDSLMSYVYGYCMQPYMTVLRATFPCTSQQVCPLKSLLQP